LSSSGYPRYIRSFPTRRSSDLTAEEARGSQKIRNVIAKHTIDYEEELYHAKENAGHAACAGHAVGLGGCAGDHGGLGSLDRPGRSEEHTSELQSRFDLVCRLLL